MHTLSYLDGVKKFLNVVSISMKGFSRCGEKCYSLGALFHQSGVCGWIKASSRKEIKNIATCIYREIKISMVVWLADKQVKIQSQQLSTTIVAVDLHI